MSLDFWKHSMNIEAVQQPNEMYRCLEQAFVDEQWDNTTARQTIWEQDMVDEGVFPDFKFHKVEAWLNYVVEQTSTGTKNGSDFIQLTFRDLEHKCVRGRYYKFADAYYIGDYTNQYDSVVQSMTVRRCNNFMRIIDPINGSLFSIPCVVGYDMSSPSFQVGSDIITPNNHATVMVQGNADTLRLFETNTRYILNGRPFKLTGYQDVINYSLDVEQPTLLYLDLYLDEIHANDDLINQIADNGEYIYDVKIISDDIELAVNSTGTLDAIVTLNGDEVIRDIEWSTSDEEVVAINKNGEYSVVGEVGTSAEITASIVGNKDAKSTINIIVASASDVEPKIKITPMFNTIAEHETIEFNVSVVYGDEIYSPSISDVYTDSEDLIITKDENDYQLYCIRRSPEPQVLHIQANNYEPVFDTEEEMEISLTSIFG